jgi:hypothetical protein
MNTKYSQPNIISKTVGKCIIALLLSVVLLNSHAAQNKALVIGISQYAEINNLRYADSDAKEFAQILTDLAGYEKSDVSVLLNQEATKKRIVEEINKVVRLSEKHPLDSFILMFAGHGIESTLTASNANEKNRNRETNIFLAPSDASIEENNFYSTGNGKEVSNETFINRAWLARQLSAIKAKSIFIILDSCYSGTKSFGKLFLENEGYSIQNFGSSSSNKWVVDVKKRALAVITRPALDKQSSTDYSVKNRKIAYLASSRDDQTSAEYEELKHGALSYCIFEYIKRRRGEVYKGESANISIEDVYENIGDLFHETKIKGVPLEDAHQPVLIPIPSFTDMKSMVFLRVQGTGEKLAANVKPKNGFLKIVSTNPGYPSNPGDVEIYVDGTKRKEQLNSTMEIAEGTHLIEIYLAKTGYRSTLTTEVSSSRQVTKSVSLRGELDVASFWLKDGIRSPGPQLEVFVDGNRVGKTKLHLDNLLAGSHQIEVRYQNVVKTRHVEIRPDSPLRINYSIIREAASADVKNVNNVVF